MLPALSPSYNRTRLRDSLHDRTRCDPSDEKMSFSFASISAQRAWISPSMKTSRSLRAASPKRKRMLRVWVRWSKIPTQPTPAPIAACSGWGASR